LKRDEIKPGSLINELSNVSKFQTETKDGEVILDFYTI